MQSNSVSAARRAQHDQRVPSVQHAEQRTMFSAFNVFSFQRVPSVQHGFVCSVFSTQPSSVQSSAQCFQFLVFSFQYFIDQC